MKLTEQEKESAKKILFDLLETLLELLRERTVDDCIVFTNGHKKHFLKKIEELRAISPDFDTFVFPNPFSTDMPERAGLLSGVEKGLEYTRRQFVMENGREVVGEDGKKMKEQILGQKIVQVLYECLARIVIYLG